MIHRIVASVGANAYAQASTIGIQLLSLPAFLTHWDLATYGQWLVISAIPSYLSLADVGMVTAAGNRMTMLHGQGDLPAANRVFQSTLAFMLAVCGAALLLMLAGMAAVPGAWLPSADSRWAIAALSAGVVFSLLGGLPEAVYRATHRYAQGTAIANTIRLAEWAGSLVALWAFGSFTAVALGALLPRALCTLAWMAHSALSAREFRWGFDAASRDEIRRTVAPAVSFMAFPAANAIGMQGLTLVVAGVLGPAAAAVFNTYRTMARVTVQATATFSHALWPEFSRLYGQGERALLDAVYRRSNRLGLAVAAAASAVVYLAAPSVLHVWSKGQIAFFPALMFTAMLYAALAGAWHIARVLLLSTNTHTSLAWQFLGVSAASVPAAWLLAHAAGTTGVMAVMAAGELVMLVVCARGARRLLGSTPALAQEVAA